MSAGADAGTREARATRDLRWNDLDMLGHVNHTVYHALLEEIRFELLRVLLGEGSSFVLVRIELDHRAEIRRWDGPLDIVGRIEEIGSKSVTIGHEILKADGTVSAEGRSVLVAFDMTTRRARAITEEERAALTTP